MSDYVTVNGVHTWYDERGGGNAEETVVLLHGGLTDSRDFTPNLARLADRFRLLLPERRGHGHTADHPGPITIELMARDTAAFLDKLAGRPAHLVGYSAGAAVALLVAIHRPDLVDRLVLISGAFHPDGMIMRPSADGTPPPQLVDAYAKVSPDGRDHFPAVLAKIAKAAAEEPGLCPADLHAVIRPTLVMAGDDDLVTLDHTLALYQNLPNAQLAIVPAASHLLLFEKPQLCTRLVEEFLTTEPKTLMPIRRG
jgi:pimeloyl-ACP methyl ester carboxylesterase